VAPLPEKHVEFHLTSPATSAMSDANVSRYDMKPAFSLMNELGTKRALELVRAYARKLGLNAAVRRPDADELLLEQDKERVPTDENETLVYYHLGRVLRGEVPSAQEAQEVFEKDGKIWVGETVSEQISVFILLFPFVCLNARTATSMLMQV